MDHAIQAAGIEQLNYIELNNYRFLKMNGENISGFYDMPEILPVIFKNF